MFPTTAHRVGLGQSSSIVRVSDCPSRSFLQRLQVRLCHSTFSERKNLADGPARCAVACNPNNFALQVATFAPHGYFGAFVGQWHRSRGWYTRAA